MGDPTSYHLVISTSPYRTLTQLYSCQFNPPPSPTSLQAVPGVGDWMHPCVSCDSRAQSEARHAPIHGKCVAGNDGLLVLCVQRTALFDILCEHHQIPFDPLNSSVKWI